MNRIASVACALSLALVGCRGGDDGPSGDDVQDPDAPMNAGEVTIQEVQSDAMPSGTQIELRGVVITAIDAFGNRTGDLFVSEPEGGPNSGVKVFGAPLETLATLQVGDLVDITSAIKHEACNEASPCGPVVFDDGASITEVMGLTAGSLVITKVGTSPLPTPAVVDAKALAAMDSAARVAEWEKYEGVLIKVTNARQLADVRTFGSNPGPDSNEFRITGIARVQSVLTELPSTATAGTCYDSITGVGDFFFNNLVLPRSAADLVGDGTGCHPMAESIEALRTASTPPEMVKLTDVYVTAISRFSNKHFWVTTSLTAAPNQGVYVYRGKDSGALMPATAVGDKLSLLVGGAVEFANGSGDTLTEIESPTWTVAAGTPGTVVPVTGQTVATLSTASTGEPYEGVMVTLTNVKVNALGTNSTTMGEPGAFGIGQMTQGGVSFQTDDDLFLVNAAVDTCIGSITGIWSYSVYDDVYTFLPTSNGTGTGTCN